MRLEFFIPDEEVVKMSDAVSCEPLSFLSSNQKTQIQGFMWKDAEIADPRGIMLIAHGMEEHIKRYDAFARFLAEHGYIVFGHSHLGHGESVDDSSQWGCLPALDGAKILVKDMHRLRSLAVARTSPGLPVFLFGHSLGSFVCRSYITRYGSGLAGVVICGTGHVAPGLSNTGNRLARLISKLRGEDYCSKLLDNMGVGSYNKSIKNPRTKLDWLSYNEENIDRYIADSACGFMFSAGGYATVTALTGEVCTRQSADKIPHELPLLFVSGIDDPVGDMGKGVKKSAELAKEAGVKDVEIKLYEKMRHEILNETDAHVVFDDVLTWLDAHGNQNTETENK